MKALLEDADADAVTPRDSAVFSARVNAKTRAPNGAPFELVVDIDGLYFFDLESGAAIGDPEAVGAAGLGATAG
jgi:hypothetical protein